MDVRISRIFINNRPQRLEGFKPSKRYTTDFNLNTFYHL
jgi:hypothetical protein